MPPAFLLLGLEYEHPVLGTERLRRPASVKVPSSLLRDVCGREPGYGPETSSRVTANSSRQPGLETGLPSISVRVQLDAAG